MTDDAGDAAGGADTGGDDSGDTDDPARTAGTEAVDEGDPLRLGDGPVLLFDGVCNLCNGAVQFVIERDPEGRIRFASLQSSVGERLLARTDLSTDALETMVLVEGARVYTKSAAAIRVADILGWPYRLARLGRLVPRRLRDAVYDVVAENRYDWFGRKDQCMVPDEDVGDRFLD